MQNPKRPGPARRLGRYELLRLIGEGGMARVWAARMDADAPSGSRTIVAVKTLIPALASDPQFQRMFLDEANLAARVQHRNVVEIYELGKGNEGLFLVMEWVDGQPLQRVLRPGSRTLRLTPGVAARVVADAAAGLHAAHELCDERGAPLGIVHRDVCPQNILIGRDGTVKVADFGIAKAIERLGETTQTGEIKGKAEYMSPEQARSHPVDRRSDVFSLGIVLFEAATGERPFQGWSDLAVMQQIANEDPPRPTVVCPDCPSELEWIILKALSRDPEQRFQTAQAMADALEEFFVRRDPGSAGPSVHAGRDPASAGPSVHAGRDPGSAGPSVHAGRDPAFAGPSVAVTSAHVAEELRRRCGEQMDELRRKIEADAVASEAAAMSALDGAAGEPSHPAAGETTASGQQPSWITLPAEAPSLRAYLPGGTPPVGNRPLPEVPSGPAHQPLLPRSAGRGRGVPGEVPSGPTYPPLLPWLIAAMSTGVAAAALLFVVAGGRSEAVVQARGVPAARGDAVRGWAPISSRGMPIAVHVRPPSAVVRMNGAVIGVGDQLIARPAPGGSITIEAQLSGCPTRKITLTAESPDRIDLDLPQERTIDPEPALAPFTPR